LDYRNLQATPSGPTYSWIVYRDNPSPPQYWHGAALVADITANTQKYWGFSTASDYTAGLATVYVEEANSSIITLEKNFYWAQSSSYNPYVGTLVTTLNAGSSYAAATTTNQVLDGYGNLTQSQVIDYAGSPTGNRTYNFTYVNGSSYLANYIFNRMATATVTPAGGSSVTLAAKTYDGGCGPYGLIATSAFYNHDPSYTTSFTIRGNPTVVSGQNSADTVCTAVDSAGVPYYSVDASGHSVNVSTSSNSNYSLPSAIMPNGNSGMQTSATYASSWAPASMTGPNGATGTTTYDAYGRPSQTVIPDGATTTYTYTYSPGASTQTATVNGRWQTTTRRYRSPTLREPLRSGPPILMTDRAALSP
jgi:YD repeat-containing protein